MSRSLPALPQELQTWALVAELTLVAGLKVTFIFAVDRPLSRSQLKGKVRRFVYLQFEGVHTVHPGGMKHQAVGPLLGSGSEGLS